MKDTHTFQSWQKQMFLREQSALRDLLCDRSYSMQIGLNAVSLVDLFRGNIVKALEGTKVKPLASSEKIICTLLLAHTLFLQKVEQPSGQH